jgi:hypothetical protein
MIKRKVILAVILCLGMAVALPHAGIAQDEEVYQVRVSKDFGYNMGSEIQGRFTIRLVGNLEKVSEVTFYVDNSILQNVEEAPFKFQFQTESYDPGIYRLSAEVLLNDGQTIRTSSVQYHFLSQKDANRQVRNVLIALGVAIIGSLAIVALVQHLIINKGGKGSHQPGTPRNYGILGGTICKKCGRPFRRHIWGINLGVGRLDRCDHCGKWSMTIRATPKALRMAEEVELEDDVMDDPRFGFEKNEGDQLEKTKYFDEV